jgi:hypothetical protein
MFTHADEQKLHAKLADLEKRVAELESKKPEDKQPEKK